MLPLLDFGDLPGVPLWAGVLGPDEANLVHGVVGKSAICATAHLKNVGSTRIYLDMLGKLDVVAGPRENPDVRVGSIGLDARSTRKQKDDHHPASVAPLSHFFHPGSPTGLSRKTSCRPIIIATGRREGAPGRTEIKWIGFSSDLQAGIAWVTTALLVRA